MSEDPLARLSEVSSENTAAGTARRRQIFRRGSSAELRHEPHGEGGEGSRSPHHRLGRNPRRQHQPERDDHELARHFRRYPSSQERSRCGDEPRRLPLFQSGTVAYTGGGTCRRRRLPARGAGLFVQPAARNTFRKAEKAHHRRAGQHLGRIHPQFQGR